MANNYFQFKQFIVQQENCAMKICTDACIYGAYVARQIESRQVATKTILDIGTGTGLLSLMLAQKTKGRIDSIELDEAACLQAKQNFEASPWRDRLGIFNDDARLFNPGKKYDCIISNPPFFEGGLRSGNDQKNAAKHDTTLTLEELLPIIKNNLSPAGFFAVLLPYHRAGIFIEIASAANYFLDQQILIRHTLTHPFFRAILFFSSNKAAVSNAEMVIKHAAGNYTPAFIALLKDYYLYL